MRKDLHQLRFFFVAFALLSCQFFLTPDMVHAQGAPSELTPNTSSSDQAAGSDQQGLFFAFLSEDKQVLDGPLVQILKDKPVIRDMISPRDKVARKYRPMLQWKRWADKTQRLIPSLFLIGIVSFFCWSLFPVKFLSAVSESKTSYWRCFGTGVLILAFSSMFARAVFITEIGWPLGILITGLTQGILLAGLSVVVYNLGHSTLLLTRLSKLSLFSENPSRARVCELLLGTLLAALILKIPELGPLPQLGTRLISFFALLGAGALFRIWKKETSKS